MSIHKGPYDNDGNGRLYERFQLVDINDRLDNLYVHLRDVVKDFGTEPPDYQPQVQQIQQMFRNHQAQVSESSANWEQQLNREAAKSNKLRDQVKILKAKLSNQQRENILQQGVDEYIESKTRKLAHALEQANKAKDKLSQQLNEERKQHERTKKEKNEYQAKTDALAKAVDKLRDLDQYDVNDAVRKERDDWREKYNDLFVKYKRKEFELDEKVSQELSRIRKAILATKSFDAVQVRELWQKDLKELNDIYNQRIREKDREWQRAKNTSIKTLDAEYKHLEQRIQERLNLELSRTRELNKMLSDNKKKYKQDLAAKDAQIKKLNEAQDVLHKNYQRKCDELDSKCREIMDLQTELSKYKVLWEHFFGLDAPLRDQLDITNEKLRKFESRHNIKSPVPNKKRKVTVRSLADWALSGYDFAPLMVGKIPNPNDVYARFQLFNPSSDSIILKDIHLKNDKNQRFVLNVGEIRPNGYIYIALKKKKRTTDLMPDPKSFQFSFLENEKLFLCDQQGNEMQIFPSKTAIPSSLAHWNESPLKATPFCDLNTSIRGFVIENICGKEINLNQHYLRNERGTFNEEISTGTIPINGKFRLIAVADDNSSTAGVKPTDIIVSSAVINGDVDDKLYLVDRLNNRFVLYEYDGLSPNNNRNHNHNNARNGNQQICFVM